MAQTAVSPESPDKPDWDFIQSLYLKGMTPKQIQDKTGVKADTVSARANRKGWRKHLVQSSVVVSVLNSKVSEAKPADNALAKQSEAAKAGLASVLQRSIEKIQAIALNSPKAALKANAELESVVRNCKTVFGWSESSTQPAVRIAIMGQATIASPETKPAIEVESSVSPEQASLNTGQ